MPARSNADYWFEIDKAIDLSTHMILVMSSIENIKSSCVNYEWTTFANEKRSGRKSGNLITLSYPNIDIAKMPLFLRQFEVIKKDDYEDIYSFLE